MESTSLSSSIALSGFRRFSGRRKRCSNNLQYPKRIIAARWQNEGRDYEGKQVDENMIILRMRMREMKMAEEGGRGSAAAEAEWTEWDKKYFSHYNSDVCEAVGLLQRFLMSTRPSLAIGLAALAAVTVSVSSGVVLFHAAEILTSMALSGFHLFNPPS